MKKRERESLRAMFAGLCAYCGGPLGDRWHADHVEPVVRQLAYVKGKGLVATGVLDWPERDHIGNLMPACPPCNIDKHNLSLDQWRRKLQDAANVLRRNASTYRHALRFGLVQETGAAVIFHFERAAAIGAQAGERP